MHNGTKGSKCRLQIEQRGRVNYGASLRLVDLVEVHISNRTDVNTLLYILNMSNGQWIWIQSP